MAYNVVDRDSPLPAYYQIALNLRQRISNGEWRTDEQIPSEPELAGEYEVSRMTMRQAVAELVKESTLVRQRGNGTFVNRILLDILPHQPPEAQISEFRAEPEKSSLRQQVWAKLRQVARPDSRFHWNFSEFVPDFEGSERCAQTVRHMEWYQHSQIIFIAPDNSLTHLRQYALEDGKHLLLATHAITRGFLLIEPGQVPAGLASYAATLDGQEQFGRPITLNDLKRLNRIDLLVTGASVVTESGVRWGKGHGYFDLEWAMFREIALVDAETPVIAVCHDCQVVTLDLKPSTFDTIADAIVTPTRPINIQRIHPKPGGILWSYLSPELCQQIPPLQTLFEQRGRPKLK